MLETAIIDYLSTEIPEVDWYWGKLPQDLDFSSPVGNIIKIPSLVSNITPSYLDNIQITVRHEYIDVATQYVTDIVTLFQLFAGMIGDYQVHIPNITNNGVIYEEEDIVAATVTISVKHTL